MPGACLCQMLGIHASHLSLGRFAASGSPGLLPGEYYNLPMSDRRIRRGLGNAAIVLGAGLAALPGACRAPPKPESAPPSLALGPAPGAGLPDAATVQSKVNVFADAYASLIAEATDEILRRAESPRVRADAQRARLNSVIAAWTIATNPNPYVALLDMTVMARLERQGCERFGGELFEGHGHFMVEAYREADRLVWDLTDDVLGPEEMAALEQLIDAWRQEHPDQRYVANVRFDDFSAERQTAQTTETGRGAVSLFGLVGLDPLAKVEPATRQIEQSRMLAERIFYFVGRLPVLVSWQAETLYAELAASPEAQQILADASRFAGASQRLTEVAAALPDELAQRVAAERAAILEGLTGEVPERSVLAELHRTFDAGKELSESLQTTSASIQSLASSFQRDEPAPQVEGEEGFDLAEFRAAVIDTATAARDLDQLVASIDRLLASSPQRDRISELEAAIALAEGSGTRLVNRAFGLGLALVAAFLAGSVLRAFLVRRLGARTALTGREHSLADRNAAV